MDIELNKYFEPQAYLDGAKVIQWAWSGKVPFGFVSSVEDEHRTNIHGLAICKYENSETIYRFSCDINWEVIQDSDYDSILDAIAYIPEQYRNVEPDWITK